MTRQAATVLLLLAACAPAWSQSRAECANAVTQQAMNACANKDYIEADAQLNAVWKDAQTAARETDEAESAENRGAAKALLKAQRGWLAYRDGHCELAGFEARGGSMEAMLVSQCLADLTRRRTKELRDFVGSPQK